MKKVLNVLKYVLFSFLLLVLILGVYVVVAKLVFKQKQPKVFGISTAVVLSGSMEPEFSVNDCLVFKKQKEYKVGDIIIFNDNGYLTTHRIVEIKEGKFITKGDANLSNDANPVKSEDVHGKMIIKINGFGKFINFLKSPMGIIVVLCCVILIVEVPALFKKKKVKNKT